MPRKIVSRITQSKEIPFADPEVAAVFRTYPDPIRQKLMELRRLIFATAQTTDGVGSLTETLKWGQPSYLTDESKSGTTIRIDQVKSGPGDYAIYVNCQTDLVETFRTRFGNDLAFSGNRAILFDSSDKIPGAVVRDCIAQALTYHRNKTSRSGS